MGGQVRSGTCSAGETCKSNGRCDPSGNPCDTTITKHDPTTNKYPLWIIPKSEDVKDAIMIRQNRVLITVNAAEEIA